MQYTPVYLLSVVLSSLVLATINSMHSKRVSNWYSHYCMYYVQFTRICQCYCNQQLALSPCSHTVRFMLEFPIKTVPQL